MFSVSHRTGRLALADTLFEHYSFYALSAPLLLRIAEDEFWFSISDSDLELWLRGFNSGMKFDVSTKDSRRIAAGILSWGQDNDTETLPFQCNLTYQVPRDKQTDYIGKARFEEVRTQIEAGYPPFKPAMAGITFGGDPVTDYASDFWLISATAGGEPVGYIPSPWYSPELEQNFAQCHVPLGAERSRHHALHVASEGVCRWSSG